MEFQWYAAHEATTESSSWPYIANRKIVIFLCLTDFDVYYSLAEEIFGSNPDSSSFPPVQPMIFATHSREWHKLHHVAFSLTKINLGLKILFNDN